MRFSRCSNTGELELVGDGFGALRIWQEETSSFFSLAR
ncbi:unnamed protein product [Rhodiola kirilowii]